MRKDKKDMCIDFNQYCTQDEMVYLSKVDIDTRNLYDAAKKFQDALVSEGFGCPEVVPTKEPIRFALPNEKNKNGWYIFHADNNPCPIGIYGNWKEQVTHKWCAKSNYELSAAEMDLVRENQRKLREQYQEDKKQKAKKAAKHAENLYNSLPLATDDVPYLQKKQVKAFGGVKDLKGTLCIPLWNPEQKLAGLQYITPAGQKYFTKNLSKKGNFGVLGDNFSTIFVAEGYATAASIHMATGQAAVVAFDSGNLEPVCVNIKKLFPQSKIVLAADDDKWTKIKGQPWNTGIETARAVSAKLKIKVVSPTFKDLSTQPTDFNDLHVLEGIESVRVQVTNQNTGIQLSDWESTSAYTGDPPIREWIIRGVFPRGQVSLVAAAGGVGKSYMLLSLARCIADNSLVRPAHFGGNLEATGSTVYISAEDDSIEIHNRLHNLGGPVKGLYAIPLPNAGGAQSYFRENERHFSSTEHWESLKAQLQSIPNITTLIIDPLQPLCAMDLNQPEAAQTVCSQIADLAASLNIAVILSHHFRKTTVDNPEDARMAIRGTAGLVDGVRSVYALWQASESDAKKTAKELQIVHRQDSLVYGCVVKGNSEKLLGTTSYIRTDTGVLEDRTDEIKGIQDNDVLMRLLIEAIAYAAENGKPYTKTGGNGVYERRTELPEPLCLFPRNRLRSLTDNLMENADVVACSAKGSKVVKWLDIPSGQFAEGVGEFEPGFLTMTADRT